MLTATQELRLDLDCWQDRGSWQDSVGGAIVVGLVTASRRMKHGPGKSLP